MTLLIILAAVVLAPAALLAVKGPGEIELMTTPKNLGVFGAEIVKRLPVVENVAGELRGTGIEEISLTNHAARIPAGMRVGADA